MTGCPNGCGVEYLLSMGDWTWLCFACKGVLRHPLAIDRHTHSDPRRLADWRTTGSPREHFIAAVTACKAELEASMARILAPRPPPGIMPEGFTTDSQPVPSIMPEGFITDSRPVLP